MNRIGVSVLAALAAVSQPTTLVAQWETQTEAPETKDRLSPESMQDLVAGPMLLLKSDGLDAARNAFDGLLTAAVKEYGSGSVEEADLLTSFGVSLYIEAIDRDDTDIKKESLKYLERAVAAYRTAFGPRHPEVAVALNSYADVAVAIGDEALRPAAVAALEEALDIRTEKLGPDNGETRATADRLAEVQNPEAMAMEDALRDASEVLTATVNLETGEVLSVEDFSDDALWKPIGYFNPLIDEFVADAKKIDAGESASKQAVAAKYALSVAALDEGIALLRDMQKNAYNDRQKAGLRARALAWLKQSNRAPIALAFTGGILDQFEDNSCKVSDVDLLMQGSRDLDADLWAIITSCTSSSAFASAIRRSAGAKPALLYLGTRWTRGEWASELAAADMLLEPEFFAQVRLSERDRIHSEIARYKLMKLIYLGLLNEALRFGDSLDPAILAMALRPKRKYFQTTINGFALKEDWSADSPAEDYAAALALRGRKAEARSVLDLIAPVARLKEERACLEAAKADCRVGVGQDIPLGALVVDQLLDDPTGDPYVLVEAGNRGYSTRTAGITESLCRLLTHPAEMKECDAAREATASIRESERLDTDDRALWEAIGEAGGQRFEAAKAHYTAILPPRPAKEGIEWTRASVDPAPVPFRELPITPELLAKSARPSTSPAVMAALPRGYNLVRREHFGHRAVAVSISTRFDPNGEVSAGGYWIHISDDGGKSWGRPLYTGLAEHFPYVISAKSQLPMLAGDRIHLEVQEALIDTASISYPPVGLRLGRKRAGIYLDIPIADLEKDSNGDGLTDIAAHHLLLDDETKGPTPFVVGRDSNCSAPRPDTIARLEVLKKLFEVEGRALIEPPDKKAVIGDWRRTQPSGMPPIFLRGNPDDWRCVSLDRPMIVYSEEDQERLRKFSPDFQLIELPSIRWNRARTLGFVNWSMGWAGGTYRLTRKSDGWDLEPISEWIT